MALPFQSEDIIHYTCWMALGGITFSVRGYYTLYMLDGLGWHYLFGIDIIIMLLYTCTYAGGLFLYIDVTVVWHYI